jgi:hypothetical protein
MSFGCGVILKSLKKNICEKSLKIVEKFVLTFELKKKVESLNLKMVEKL